MKRNHKILLAIIAIIIIAAPLSYLLLLREEQTGQKPPPRSAFVAGTLFGKVVDAITGEPISSASVEVRGSYPSVNGTLESLTNSSGSWEFKNLNLTVPIYVSADKEGFYPIRGATRSTEQIKEDLHTFGLVDLFRISNNFTFAVSQWISTPPPHSENLQDGQNISIPRNELLALLIKLQNHDDKSVLGQEIHYVNIISVWAYPMEDTISINFGGDIIKGKGEWTTGPLGGLYIDNVSTFCHITFEEIGNYTVFIRLKDNHKIYTAMKIYVDVFSPPGSQI